MADSPSKIPESPRPAVGDVVETTSGRLLGRVGDVGQGCFRIDDHDSKAEPMWLTAESIFTRSGAHVTLVCEREGLERYAASPPI